LLLILCLLADFIELRVVVEFEETYYLKIAGFYKKQV